MKALSVAGGATRNVNVQGTRSLGMYISGPVQLPDLKSIQQFILYTSSEGKVEQVACVGVVT